MSPFAPQPIEVWAQRFDFQKDGPAIQKMIDDGEPPHLIWDYCMRTYNERLDQRKRACEVTEALLSGPPIPDQVVAKIREFMDQATSNAEWKKP